MNVKTLALAAAAAAVATPSMAADLPVVAEPVNYVEACDAFGAGFFKLPGQDTCIKLGGRIRANYESHDLNKGLGDVTEAGSAEVNALYTVNGTTGAVSGVTADDASSTGYYITGTTTEVAADDIESVKVKDATEDKTNDYDSYVKGYLYFTSMTATEFGTIKTFTELVAKWDDEGATSHDTGDVYVQFGMDYGSFLVGRTASLFDSFTGYTSIGPANTAMSDDSALQVRFTGDLGNGFTASVAAQDSSYRGGEDNAVDILGALKLTQAWGSLKVAGVAHNKADGDDYGYAVGGTATFNLDMIREGSEFTFQAQYADEAGKYIDAPVADVTGYNLAAGLNVALTDTVSAQVDASYLDLDVDSDYTNTAVNGSVIYSPVAGLALSAAAGWEQADEKDADHDAITKVGARVQYTF